MSYVMAIALICGSRIHGVEYVRDNPATKCQEKFIDCYAKETGDLDTRLIKCIRKGN